MNHLKNLSRLNSNWTTAGAVLATLVALAAASIFLQPAGASATGCETANVEVFTDSLQGSWYSASWSGTTTVTSNGANEITFPKRWSAFSVQTKSANVAECDVLVFDIASEVNNPALRVRLDDASEANAGSLELNDPAFIANATITPGAKQVRIPLDKFDLPAAEVTRLSIINASGTADIKLTVDNIRFERLSEPGVIGSSVGSPAGAANAELEGLPAHGQPGAPGGEIAGPLADGQSDVVMGGMVGSPNEEPPVDAPSTPGNDQALDVPVTDSPVTDSPVTDSPVTDSPVADVPGTTTPVADDRPLPAPVEVASCPIVYDDVLHGPWQPASWSVAEVDYLGPSDRGGSVITTSFPKPWGAISVLTTEPIDVHQCAELTLDVSASTGNVSFKVELSGADRTVDGSKTISVTNEVATVRLALDEFNLAGNKLSRISLVNRGPKSDFSVSVDNISLGSISLSSSSLDGSSSNSGASDSDERQPAPTDPAGQASNSDQINADSNEATMPNPATPADAKTPGGDVPPVVAPGSSPTGATPDVGWTPGSKFKTLRPGVALPTGVQCASRVRPTPETVSENTPWNQRVGRSVVGETYISDQLYYVEGPAAFEARIDGNYTGTTDEIIQWAACKWGFDEDLIRAQVYTESSWFAGRLGDCGDGPTLARTGGTDGCDSNGLLQVRGSDVRSSGNATHMGTFPMAWDSSAFNLDYALAVERICFEGQEVWLAETAAPSTTYRSGDLYGCLGRWYSGEWRVPGAIDYINAVKRNLANRSWEKASGRGCPNWMDNFYCSGISRNVDGSRK